MKLPKHNVECSLTHFAPGHDYFDHDVVEFVANCWINNEERDAAIRDRTAWVLHWYPRTSVGSCVLAARTLNALLHYLENDEAYQTENYE